MKYILDKILPYEARAEFCQIFRSFFGQWSFKKNCFWDLLTFNSLISLRHSQYSKDSLPPVVWQSQENLYGPDPKAKYPVASMPPMWKNEGPSKTSKSACVLDPTGCYKKFGKMNPCWIYPTGCYKKFGVLDPCWLDPARCYKKFGVMDPCWLDPDGCYKKVDATDPCWSDPTGCY